MLDQEKIVTYLQSFRSTGCESSYYMFLKQVEGYVKRVLFKKINNSQLLEETAQEIMLAIHKSLPSYDISRPILPWVNSIVFHKTIDFYRKNEKYKNDESLDNQFDIGKDVTMEDGIVVQEVLEILAKDIFGSSYLQQKVMGKSIKEISDNMGISESNIKVKIHRLTKKIREALS